MSQSNRSTLVFVVLLVVLVVGVKLYLGRHSPNVPEPDPDAEKTVVSEETSEPAPKRPPPPPETTAQVHGLGLLRVSDDAELKRGDFWLEQTLTLPPLVNPGPVADLYLSIDPATATGMRLRLDDKAAVLERLTKPEGAQEPACEELAKGSVRELVGPAARAGGDQVLGALWRNGELAVWWNGTLLFTWKGDAKLDGPSGAAVSNDGTKAGPRRAIPLGRVAFRDTFMRESAGYVWRPARGKWELTQMAFPERSANPFSLRASFGQDAPAADKLYRGRMRTERYGIGVMIGDVEGTIHIVRITGGSPAARAGLQEDDTIVAIDGQPIEQLDRWRLNQLLYTDDGGRAGTLRLKILRPGEKALRDFVIPRDQFVWGTPMTGTLIQPVSQSDEALILGGEAGWSDYAAEACVKPLGAGACGLAVAVTSPGDCLLLRWQGPKSDQNGGEDEGGAERKQPEAAHERLQLVRVEGGVEKILAEKPMAYRPYEFYRMTLDWSGEDVRALVDGAEVFREKVPGLRRGQVGLYAGKGEPVFFDDVGVFSNRKELGGSNPERRINEIFAAEQDMERWANPALEWDRDEKTGWALHAYRFPGEQAVVLNRPKFDQLELALGGGADLPARGGLRITLSGRIANFSDHGGRNAKALELPAAGPYQRVAVRAGADQVFLDVDGQTLTWTREPEAAKQDGDRLAVRGLKNLGDPRTVRVTSRGTYEYTFDGAPADWKVACGRWGLLNKWICDPRWSWFGGRSSTVAAIWNKQVFGGNVSVDAHVAVMMEQDDPPYERAGDYNLTICGDGVHLDSGYAVIFGGGRNYWTRLYRNGVQVAEATAEDARLPGDRVRQPDKPELHQRWFHLRLEKAGNQVSFYRDGVKAFTFTDPDPLGEGRVAFWTVDNGVLLSRCRIASDAVRPGPLEARASELFDDGNVINMYDGEVHTSVALEAMPQEISASVGAAPARFKPADAAAIPEAKDQFLAKAWRVTNAIGGGSFALQWKRLRLDPSSNGVLRFGMRLDPGAAVDLYLKDTNSGELFRWRVSGPKSWDEGLPAVGTIPLAADGRWHTVQFDLGPSWAELWKRRGYDAPPRASLRPMFGCLAWHDYTVAGFGGNRAGASYAVTDLMALKPEDVDFTPPSVAKVIWPYDEGGDGHSVKVVFDDAGGSGVDPTTVRLAVTGTAVPPEMVRFDGAAQTATFDLLAWRAGKAFTEGQSVALTVEKFADRAGNPVAQASSYAFTFKSSAAKTEPQAPLVEALMDADPRQSARGLTMVRPPGVLGREDVWPATGVLEAMVGESADAPRNAEDPRSVQVSSLRDGSHFGMRVRTGHYNLANWPYLAIEYKIPFEVPVNLHFNDGGNPRMPRQTLLLTDTGEAEGRRGRFNFGDQNSACHGPPEGFVADGTWRRVEIPLMKMLAAESPEQEAYEISNLDLREGGYRGNRRGMSYLIHKIEALPAARARGIAFLWRPRDLAPEADFASALDENPDTVPAEGRKDIQPMESVQGAAKRMLEADAQNAPGKPQGGRMLADGWKYLHVRTRNAAGVWSRTRHYKFRVDNSPPRVSKFEPGPGARYAGRTVSLSLADDHVVLQHSLKFSVNGRTLAPGDPGVTFDGERNVLTYDDTASANPLNWADGSEVKVQLLAAADSLGNELAEPCAFSFVADRSADRKGPAIAQVRFAAPDNGIGESLNRPAQLEISLALNFEETLGHVRALQDCRLDWTDDPRTAAFGRRSARFVMQDDDCDACILLHKNAWYMDSYPILHFDYKSDPGVNVDVQAQVLGEWYTIRFLGDGKPGDEGGREAGSIASIKANGQWNHASVNLRDCIERAVPRLPVRIISQIRLSAHGQAGAKRGASLWIDNLHMAPEAGTGGRVEWEAEEDESGIWGYSMIMDRSADTEAPKSVALKDTFKAEYGRTGTWYAHIRACDQAGNWGPTRHYRIDF
ncbi:MAG: PDZ domain-containing protein [Planctomycetota bacterium]|nr:PDZ domain-containing protein [Planctomycetota bacterium]